VVEFSSPNPGQEFSGDHLRSTITGAFIAAIHESMGWEAFRINFLGDWGKHIGLLAVGWVKFHSDDRFNKDPLRHLLNIYTRAKELFKSEQEAVKEAPKTNSIQTPPDPINQDRDAFFKQMEDGKLDALALWDKLREPCLQCIPTSMPV
jgi:arginyl-tRNA synthetase